MGVLVPEGMGFLCQTPVTLGSPFVRGEILENQNLKGPSEIS